jgi:hypothetical protein
MWRRTAFLFQPEASMRTLIAIAVMLAVGLGGAVAKQKQRKAAPREPQRQIACTVIGCVPVPRGCWQTPGRNWKGDPTGGDIIVCPPGVAPFR